MGRQGSLGNAVIESLHSTLEFELRSVEHLIKGGGPGQVGPWTEDYNRHRRHSALGMMSLVDDGQAFIKAGKAA